MIARVPPRPPGVDRRAGVAAAERYLAVLQPAASGRLRVRDVVYVLAALAGVVFVAGSVAARVVELFLQRP